MNQPLHIENKPIPLKAVVEYLFGDQRPEITFSEGCKTQIQKSHQALIGLIEKRVPIYGVNTAMHLVSLAQALDLRGRTLKGPSRELYAQIRQIIPFVEHDQPLGESIEVLATRLRKINEQL